MLSELGARNIDEYNKKIVQHNRPLPNVVIFIDELADLMIARKIRMQRDKLAQMSRATGIHMVLATQALGGRGYRPDQGELPGARRLCRRLGHHSRVILGPAGTERLLGQGDMLFQSPDVGAPVRLQGAFVSDRELNRIIDYWKGARRFRRITTEEAQPRTEPPTIPAIPGGSARPPQPAPVTTASTIPPPHQQPLWEDLIEEAGEEPEYEDELVPEAIALVRDLGKASTSLLQRRFRIGYTRASRIMDVMEAEGIIGPPTGTSKAREVLPQGEAGESVAAGAGADDGEDEERFDAVLDEESGEAEL